MKRKSQSRPVFVALRHHVYGAVVRVRRKELGLTQQDVARRGKCRQADVSRVERGQAGPRSPKVPHILRGLGLTEVALQDRAERIVSELMALGIRSPWYLKGSYDPENIPVDAAFVHLLAEELHRRSELGAPP